MAFSVFMLTFGMSCHVIDGFYLLVITALKREKQEMTKSEVLLILKHQKIKYGAVGFRYNNFVEGI